MELIDKAAVVAEIEKIIEEPAPSHDSQCSWEDGYYCGLCKAESIIDNLEVKEADFETVFAALIDHFDEKNNYGQWPESDLRQFANHFFELGLNTHK